MPPRHHQAQRAGTLPGCGCQDGGRQLDDATDWAGTAAAQRADRPQMLRARRGDSGSARSGRAGCRLGQAEADRRPYPRQPIRGWPHAGPG
eukprot:13504132-Alexandrium_andersonii.AAC.1